MIHLVCFLKNDLTVKVLKDALSLMFIIDVEEVKDLFSAGSTNVRYEIRNISQNQIQDFNFELNIYVKEYIILKSCLFNNLIFAHKLSKDLNLEVLINDESDDPYQWILIEKNDVFLVEEMDTENSGIHIIESSKRKLILNKAIELLPNKKFIESNIKKDHTYFVVPSTKWLKCIDPEDINR